MDLSHFHKLTESAFINCDILQESFAENLVIYNEGDELNYIRFILKGDVSVLKDGHPVWKGHENEFIGLSSYFNEKNVYSNSAVTASKTVLLKIKTDDFKNALNESKQLSSSIISSLLKRIKYTSDYSSNVNQLKKKRNMGFY